MILKLISDLLGAPEQGLRLLISLIIGYPMLYIHKKHLKDSAPIIQHIFFIVCGVGISVFNCGSNVMHSMICVLSAWFVLLTLGATLMSVVINFSFQMIYLLLAYYLTGTDTYDIKWTMPHCVLTLRLIALTFDVYDGKKDVKELSKDQQLTALSRTPSLIEIAGQTYFPASFMVGPQFSMKRYMDFVHQKLHPKEAPSPEMIGIKRGVYGLLFLALNQIGSSFLPDLYLISQEYKESSFVYKMVILGIWGKIMLYKYISCWMITEGACIYSGLAYSGKDENGQHLWKGCANVKVFLFETGTQFQDLIKGFNTNTNNWLAQYIYKRLKFLNNVYLSQLGALVFLSLWHGFHSGYYACFFMEFIIIYFEKNLSSLLRRYPETVALLESPPISYFLYVIMKAYALVFMGYSLASFALLKSSRYMEFYHSVYYIGHIFFASWFLAKPLLNVLLKNFGGKPLERPSSGPTTSYSEIKKTN